MFWWYWSDKLSRPHQVHFIFPAQLDFYTYILVWKLSLASVQKKMQKSKKSKLFSSLKLAALKVNKHNWWKWIFLETRKKCWKEKASSAFHIFGIYFITKLATLKLNKHNGLDESRFFLRPKTVEDWDGIISVRHLLQCTDSVQTVQCYDWSFVIQLLPPLEQQRLKHEMGKLFQGHFSPKAKPRC